MDQLSYVDASTERYVVNHMLKKIGNNVVLRACSNYFIKCNCNKRFMFHHVFDSTSNLDSILLIVDVMGRKTRVTVYIISEGTEILDQGPINGMIYRYVKCLIKKLIAVNTKVISNIMTYLSSHLASVIYNREFLLSCASS